MTDIQELNQQGQSVWLNYLRRAMLESGQLRHLIETMGIQGITINPAIFERAITYSADYDQVLTQLLAEGLPIKQMYEALVIDDVQRAADCLHPIFEATKGRDGFVSLPLDPALADDVVGLIAMTRHLLHEANRANVMIEIPATEAGIAAIRQLFAEGTSVHVTHVFSQAVYEQVAQAYLDGIEAYLDEYSVWRIVPSSVVSVAISQVDNVVDELLDGTGRPDLQGEAGLALAKILHSRQRFIFSGSRWEKLMRRGVQIQRLLWTRLTPKSFVYPDTHYVGALLGANTVLNVSPGMFNALRHRERPVNTLTAHVTLAYAHFDRLAEVGIDMKSVLADLQARSFAAYQTAYERLVASTARKRNEMEAEWEPMVVEVGTQATAVTESLQNMCDNRIMGRIWTHDHTVWQEQPHQIKDRLGWLHIMDVMQENVDRLQSFTQSLVNQGFDRAVFIGMGGYTQAATMYNDIFANTNQSHLKLDVLTTIDPDALLHHAEQMNLQKTLFVIVSKVGKTLETISLFKYFYNWVVNALGEAEAGQHFIAITNPGSPLVTIARDYHFRQVFIDDPHINGRFTALSYSGLVPAALTGVDLDKLLNRAQAMSCNASSCNCPLTGDNLAAKLGTLIAEMAKTGHDKLTFIISPAIAPLGDWIEQLIAASTGKQGVGILPVVGEDIGSPEAYGDDRLFVYLKLAGDNTFDQPVHVLQQSGFPLVQLQLRDLYDVGGQIFLWQMATAVAAHHLGIHPFDQPDIEANKQLTDLLIQGYQATGDLPPDNFSPLTAESLQEFLALAQPGDYISLQAFLTPTPAVQKSLHTLRMQLQRQTGMATTITYGPHILHTTGQLHKGGGKGLFIQLISDVSIDISIPAGLGYPITQLTFGKLRQIQAYSDAQTLQKARRQVLRFNLGRDVIGTLEKLSAVFIVPVTIRV